MSTRRTSRAVLRTCAGLAWPLTDAATLAYYASRMERREHPQAALELLILTTLAAGPNHGFGIALHIEKTSSELLRVEEGSLYPALHRLEKAGFIDAEWTVTPNARRARVYRLTRQGRKRLKDIEASWATLTEGVRRVLRWA
jgi:PadR family transcriptional regulator, regulatory protein PadR